MSQKTPSDKNARLKQAKERISLLISNHPKTVLVCMVGVIAFSFGVTFIYPLANQFGKSGRDMLEDTGEIKASGFSELNLLMDMGTRAKKIYYLQKDIEKLLEKKQLSVEDSAFLENALRELEYFGNQKDNDHENKME